MASLENRGPTPLDDDWKADFDPSYEEKTQEGGAWHGLDDDAIVLLQIQEFRDAEHEERHRRLDEIEANEDDD